MERDNISIYIDIVDFMKSACCKNKKSETKLKKVVDFLKIMNEENRLKILCLLQKDEQCVCDIWQCLKLPQNLVSHHLKILKDFGLISSKKIVSSGASSYDRSAGNVIRETSTFSATFSSNQSEIFISLVSIFWVHPTKAYFVS